ncbi:MAG TPA: hypothetical protein VEY11_02195 [Pyrinomonadaceae bacterium]|nr:hypothetical protein [Pyrinomonadaceae bacterium]
MIAYAVFPADSHFHLLGNAYRTRTLCDLSTKGGRSGIRERRPPAVVTYSPPALNYTLCPLCMEQAGRKQ